MKKRVSVGFMCILMLALTLLAGCGGSYESASETVAMEAPASEEYYAEDIYTSTMVTEEAVEGETGSGSAEPAQAAQTQRKLIRNVNLDVETENFDALMSSVAEKTKEFGGYIEQSRVYNGSQYYYERRNADITLRIPAEGLDDFLSAVSENCNVISQNETVEDVTLRYVDLKSHKEALETEQDRLTVEDIITIESRLSEVRYQLESMESQLRTLENQVSYSTVYLYIAEVKRYTPVKEQTTWEKISTGFVDSIYDVGEGIRDFFIGFIVNIPYLVVWAVVITVVILIIRFVRKIAKKKKMKKPENPEAKSAVKNEEKADGSK